MPGRIRQMIYVKKGEAFSKENLNTQFEQVFSEKTGRAVSMSAIMEAVGNGEIDGTDIVILEYIYNAVFCIKKQLLDFCSTKNIPNIENRIQKLLDFVAINKFILTDNKKFAGAFPSDAEVFYCLHTGGWKILQEMKDMYVDWYPGRQVTGSRRIIRYCLTADILSKVMSINGNVRTEITPNLIFQVGSHTRKEVRDVYIPSTIRYVYPDGSDEFLIIETFISSAKKVDNERLCRDYSFFLNTNTWKKYLGNCPISPTMLFVVDSVETANELFSKFSFISNNKDTKLMFLTFEDLINGRNEVPYYDFYMYNKETDTLTRENHYLFS